MLLKMKNQVYEGVNGKKHLFDLVVPSDFSGKLVLFAHGFMGFKDWGCWNILMDRFVSEGIGFCKFNLSHNGTTIEDPADFTDPEAFGKNSYFKELQDLRKMIDLVKRHVPEMTGLYLMGHSRGGGMVILAGDDSTVKGVISLAGISHVEGRFPKEVELEKWKAEGVRYVHNSRTGQDLPMYYVQFEEFLEHQNELNIEKACRGLKKPLLLVHGDKDTSVSIKEGFELAEYSGQQLHVIEGADHVFGSKHPWDKDVLPKEMEKVFQLVLEFVNKPTH
jgi:uncharacterized protein